MARSQPRGLKQAREDGAQKYFLNDEGPVQQTVQIYLAVWVRNWVQPKKEEWLSFSRKRHQMGHFEF
jgi:hypothetical protein